MRTAVRIIFDPLDFTGHPVFVALEVYDPVMPSMAAAAMANGDSAVIVTPTTARLRREQRLVRIAFVEVFAYGPDDETTSGRGWLGFAYWHVSIPLICLLGAHEGDVIAR